MEQQRRGWSKRDCIVYLLVPSAVLAGGFILALLGEGTVRTVALRITWFAALFPAFFLSNTITGRRKGLYSLISLFLGWFFWMKLLQIFATVADTLGYLEAAVLLQVW